MAKEFSLKQPWKCCCVLLQKVFARVGARLDEASKTDPFAVTYNLNSSSQLSPINIIIPSYTLSFPFTVECKQNSTKHPMQSRNPFCTMNGGDKKDEAGRGRTKAVGVCVSLLKFYEWESLTRPAMSFVAAAKSQKKGRFFVFDVWQRE